MMNKRTFFKNTLLLCLCAMTLTSSSSLGQKPIDLKDCRTINRIMNDTAIKNFLYSHVNRFDECIFESPKNLPGYTQLNIGCTIDIGNRRYKIFDSAGVAANRFVWAQIVQIQAYETNMKSISLFLEWMEVAAVFEVSRSSMGYHVKLIRVDHLD